MKMECNACNIINEEQDNVVYEDEKTLAISPLKPKAKGRIFIFPKEHIENIDDISKEDLAHYFYVSSFAATTVFEGLGAQGTNIIAYDKHTPDSLFGHFYIEILPRSEEDGFSFEWDPKKIGPEELENIKNKIKDKAFFVGKKGDQKSPAKISEDNSSKEDKDNDDNSHDYLIKSLNKIP